MTDGNQESLQLAPGTARVDPRLFSIPAGAEFIPTLVDALLGQRLIPGFPDSADPLALSDARIFVPTRRAAKALASEIARQLGSQSAILPQILPLGALADSDDMDLFDPVLASGLSAGVLLEAIPNLERRLVLTELILQWGRQIRHAILSVDETGRIVEDETEPFVVTGAPGQAFHLAGELGALIDEMIIEDVDWRALETLTPDNLDRYWSITLEFLKIAMQHWPEHLAETSRIDEVRRNVLLAEAEAERLAASPPKTPYIVAGSTGTNSATAKLMAAIARLPAGAVILPGVDFSMSDSSWQFVSGADESTIAASHPQAAIGRLLARFGVTREAVAEIASAGAPLAARMHFISTAMLPPEATSSWNAFRKSQADSTIENALSGVCFIEAENERQEAQAIAVTMREVLEIPGRTAALITPDRKLAQRVRSELLRWDIAVDDSGGDSLKGQSAGVLVRLALQLAQGAFAIPDIPERAHVDPIAVIGLFNHADVRLGYSADRFRQIVRQFEIGVLRGPAVPLQNTTEVIEKARKLANNRHAHRSLKRIDDAGWADIAACLEKLTNALNPLTHLSGSQSLHVWFKALCDTLRALRAEDDAKDASGPRVDYEALDDLVSEFLAAPETSIRLTIAEFLAFFETVASQTPVRSPQSVHPRLKILGLLEARLLSADLKILAGLDETIWPPGAPADAFLNRPMREALGLSPPERRIAQTSHDFVEAMGAHEIVLTRARKRDGAPTIPSRLLQRMQALAGEDVWGLCRARGGVYLKLADSLDRPDSVAPVLRPEPMPPVDMRPQRLSVTQIETWRRDPYAIFARYVLGLAPLDPAGVIKTPIDIGNGLHEAIEVYQKGTLASETVQQAQARMAAVAEHVFADLLHDIHIRTFRWPRILAALESFVVWDMDRRASLADIHIEETGRLELALADGSPFVLTARADRIEQTASSTAILVDYKSSRPRKNGEIEVGFAPQLPLEAVMIEQGAFEKVAKGTPVEDALFLTLLGSEGVQETKLGQGKFATKNLDELKSEHLQGLINLANQFRLLDTAYIPRPYPQYINHYGEYDHLARVKEWSDGADGGET